MARFKEKIVNFRCTPELDELLRNAAHEVRCPPSRLLRDFVRDGCELIMRDPKLANELRRKYAVS
jgi:hypothetical protein